MISMVRTLAIPCLLAGCVVAPFDNPTDNGQGPVLSVQRAGSTSFVAASDPTMGTGGYGCPLGSTQIPAYDDFAMIESGSRITVAASDPDGIRSLLITLTTLSGHSPPEVSDIHVLGLVCGVVQPVNLPNGLGSFLTQIRVDFEDLDPGINRQTRTVDFEVEFEEPFRIVTTATDPNADATTLPNQGAPGRPANILCGNLTECLN